MSKLAAPLRHVRERTGYLTGGAPPVSWGVPLQESQRIHVLAGAPWLLILGSFVAVAGWRSTSWAPACGTRRPTRTPLRSWSTRRRRCSSPLTAIARVLVYGVHSSQATGDESSAGDVNAEET